MKNEEEIFAIVKTQFEAIHSWEGCDIDRVNFLQNEHHHIFDVEVRIKQEHDNRDIEYLNMKKNIDEVLENSISKKNRSCEQYAKLIRDAVMKMTGREDVEVIVKEDNGCGAYVR